MGASQPILLIVRISIRKAEPEDLDWLVAELRRFSVCFGTKLSLFPDDPDLARRSLNTILESHCLFVAVRTAVSGSERVGLIAGICGPHMFNPSIRVLTEIFWWVPPEHRMTRAGLLLLDAFIDWGETHADWIDFTLEERSPVNERCLTRQGFRLQEKHYLMEVT